MYFYKIRPTNKKDIAEITSIINLIFGAELSIKNVDWFLIYPQSKNDSRQFSHFFRIIS